MRSAVIRSFLVVGCLRTVVAQYAFTAPEPAVADFDPTNDVVQGTVYNVVWVANNTYQPTLTGQKLLDDDGNISVWITSFNNNDYTHCLTPSANSEAGGSWAWNVSLSDDEIDANGGKFVYRLKPTVSSESAPFDTTEDECPSRGFTIRKASDVAASSSSASEAYSKSVALAASASRAAASRSAAATQTTQSDPTSTATSTTGPAAQTGAARTGAPTITNSPSSSKSSGLSGGAKAGIAIGIIAIAGIAAVAAFLLFRRRRHTTNANPTELAGTPQYAPAPMMQNKPIYAYTDHPQNVAPVELPDSHAFVELPVTQK